MTAKTMPLADVTHDAIRILCKEIGIVNNAPCGPVHNRLRQLYRRTRAAIRGHDSG